MTTTDPLTAGAVPAPTSPTTRASARPAPAHGGSDPTGHTDPTSRSRAWSLPDGWAADLKPLASALWMNVLIVAVVLVATFSTGELVPSSFQPGSSASTRAVTLFVIWMLSFVPGWLYVRFLGVRADSVWTDYVLALHRLRVDEPANLPRPPDDSVYASDANAYPDHDKNIYRQKFDAYYGPNVSRGRQLRRESKQHERRDPQGRENRSGDRLFPVFLFTEILAVAWTLILWNPKTLIAPGEPWPVLTFGFLGVYAFAVSMLVRRFFQSDLRPSAYAALVVRVILVMLIVAVLHQLFRLTEWRGTGADASQYVTAFVIGFFPIAGLQALRSVAAHQLRGWVPSLKTPYPLDELDGLNLWYETRLVEEGVEDMQNLTSVNLVDVILHTRAPIGRVIDWLDQAYLYLHLPPRPPDVKADKAHPAATEPHARDALRAIGIRTATDLIKMFRPGAAPYLSAQWLRSHRLDPDVLDALARLLADDPGLDPVWNWKAGAIAQRCPASEEQLAGRRCKVISANTRA